MRRVTVAFLTYQSPAWLEWCHKGLTQAENVAPFELHIVANDPTPAVRSHPLVTHVFDNPDPDEFYLKRVYRAWNYAVRSAETDLVVLLNSDMYVADGWLDELLAAYDSLDGKAVVTSSLVESGRILSGMPELVHQLGYHPDNFNRYEWAAVQQKVRTRAPEIVHPGRLYMPVLLRRDVFLDLGGYPIGNPGGVPGDNVLFEYLAAAGFPHYTAVRSVCYHAQQGEMDNP